MDRSQSGPSRRDVVRVGAVLGMGVAWSAPLIVTAAPSALADPGSPAPTTSVLPTKAGQGGGVRSGTGKGPDRSDTSVLNASSGLPRTGADGHIDDLLAVGVTALAAGAGLVAASASRPSRGRHVAGKQ